MAVLSDTHGHLDERIAAAICGSDYIVHAGDVGSRAVVAQLRARKAKPLVVRGNNDTPAKWLDSELEFLQSLPHEASLDLPGGRLVVVHGHRGGTAKKRHDWLRRRHADAKVIAYGHSHRLCVDCDDLPWVINPGAAGWARTFGGPSYVIISASEEEWMVEPRRFPPRKKSRRA